MTDMAGRLIQLKRSPLRLKQLVLTPKLLWTSPSLLPAKHSSLHPFGRKMAPPKHFVTPSPSAFPGTIPLIVWRYPWRIPYTTVLRPDRHRRLFVTSVPLSSRSVTTVLRPAIRPPARCRILRRPTTATLPLETLRPKPLY